MNSSPRGRGTDKAQRSPALAHLTLTGLRTYRQYLREEEERVAYWRRLVQTRINGLSTTNPHAERLAPDALARALGDTGTGARRQTLIDAAADHPLPALPALNAPWASRVATRDETSLQQARDSLAAAEAELTAYREAIQVRLSSATSELIARYASDPTAAFDLIPETDKRTSKP